MLNPCSQIILRNLTRAIPLNGLENIGTSESEIIILIQVKTVLYLGVFLTERSHVSVIVSFKVLSEFSFL